MSQILIHNLDTPWTSSDVVLFDVTVDTENFMGEGAASNRLTASRSSMNTFAYFEPAAPLDLSRFDEIRFWVQGGSPADGSAARPFFLEFSYTDAGDMPGEQHRWLVPVGRASCWEHRRIGIENDRRTAITRFRFTSLTNSAFTCRVDELLAVREEMLIDLEQSLTDLLDRQVALPGLTNLALSEQAVPGAQQIVVALNRDLGADNRILLRGAAAADETHDVTAVNHDTAANTTTLTLPASDPVRGDFTTPGAELSVIVPAIVESPPGVTPAPTPAIILTLVDAREDLDRTGYATQRDSFRQRGALTHCSVRPAPRAYLIDYQITAVAPSRAQQVIIQTLLEERLSIDKGLRINGEVAPVWTLAPPALLVRRVGLSAPVYLRIGARMETAPRRETPWVRRADVRTGPGDAPTDQEGIVIVL